MSANNVNLSALDTKMEELLAAFNAHPGLQPPNTHPTVFFVADFVHNTHRALKNIDQAKYQAGDAACQQEATEVLGRNGFANMLISDATGRLNALTGGGPPVDFGDDIRAKIKEVVEA
ncbi:hypothetical protein FE257_008655 [Aspergillus nanangensis]|uniref:Uncharacterized protein n=1 Tax=Aspergillus nanangensis TaxID=2582783 RepID=A0AAD4CMM7_ASPNN|nr:hypothetical protein FE257_008655 [Aspergillus nanangensis]